jgi:hypothetical protein
MDGLPAYIRVAERAGGFMKIPRAFLYAGIGAALMYFLDPQHGEHRREMLRDQASNLMVTADSLMEQRGELASRAREALMETKRMVDTRIEALEESADNGTTSTATSPSSSAAPKRTRSTRTSSASKSSGD